MTREELPLYVTVAIVGPFKCGKTHFLASLPKPLFLQFDTNASCAGDLGFDHLMIDFTAMPAKEAWDLFFNRVIPALYNREPARLNELEVRKRDLSGIQSVCLDSETFCFETMQDAVPIPKTNKGEQDTFRWYRNLRELKKQQYYKLMSLARPFAGDPSRPRFNVGVACHMKEEYSDIPGTDKKVLSRWVPALEGSFKDKFGAYTNALFWADSTRNGDDTTYFMHTKSPDKFRIADDSVGGNGRYKVLPPRIENSWQVLMRGWGVEQ